MNPMSINPYPPNTYEALEFWMQGVGEDNEIQDQIRAEFGSSIDIAVETFFQQSLPLKPEMVLFSIETIRATIFRTFFFVKGYDELSAFKLSELIVGHAIHQIIERIMS